MEPVTHPAPHDGRIHSIPHVVRRLPQMIDTGGYAEPRPILISLPRISIQKDW